MQRRREMSILLSIVGLVLAVGLSSMQDSQRPLRSGVSEGGGHDESEAHRYDPPRRVTVGEYEPTASSADAADRGDAAAREDAKKPDFEGDVNGIFVYSDSATGSRESGSGRYGSWPCEFESMQRSVTRWGDAAADGDQFSIEPKSLPAGTFELYERSTDECPDSGIVHHSSRIFGFGEGGYQARLAITRIAGPRVASAAGASVDRVRAGSVKGRPAVIVDPHTEEGWGSSMIFIRESFGMTVLAGEEFSIADLLEIAEGL